MQPRLFQQPAKAGFQASYPADRSSPGARRTQAPRIVRESGFSRETPPTLPDVRYSTFPVRRRMARRSIGAAPRRIGSMPQNIGGRRSDHIDPGPTRGRSALRMEIPRSTSSGTTYRRQGNGRARLRSPVRAARRRKDGDGLCFDCTPPHLDADPRTSRLVARSMAGCGDAFSWTREKGDRRLERNEAANHAAIRYWDAAESIARTRLLVGIVWIRTGRGGRMSSHSCRLIRTVTESVPRATHRGPYRDSATEGSPGKTPSLSMRAYPAHAFASGRTQDQACRDCAAKLDRISTRHGNATSDS